MIRKVLNMSLAEYASIFLPGISPNGDESDKSA